jgi:hypothetical protein
VRDTSVRLSFKVTGRQYDTLCTLAQQARCSVAEVVRRTLARTPARDDSSDEQ